MNKTRIKEIKEISWSLAERSQIMPLHINVATHQNQQPPEQRTFGRGATESKDRPHVVSDTGDLLAITVKVGLGTVQPEVLGELRGDIGHVAHGHELVGPAGSLGDGTEVTKGVERGLATVGALSGCAYTAKRQGHNGTVHVGIVE